MKVIITIETDNSQNDLLLPTEEVNYGSKWTGDLITIYKNKIEISGDRSDTKDNYNSISRIYNSTFYNHIIRSLVFLFATEMKPMKIRSFIVKRTGPRTDETLFSIVNENEINQHFPSINGITPTIGVTEYFSNFDIFNKRRKNDCYTDIMMYYLQGISETEDEKKAFEYLWRSVNCLSAHHSNIGTTDSSQLSALKSYIELKSENFTASKTFLTERKDSIETQLSWNRYFSNKILRDSAYKDISIRQNRDDIDLVFEDRSFLETFKKLFFVEGRNLSGNSSLKTLVSSKIDQNITKDTDFLTFMLTKFIYALRCSNFHAEINYERFTLFNVNKYDKEFSIVNGLLKILIPELINSLPSDFFIW